MLRQPTLDLLRELRLSGMAQAFEEQTAMPDISELSFEDRLSLLLEREKTEREQRRYVRLKGLAKLHLDATIEDLNFKAPRGLDRSLVLRLASGRWIRDGQTVLISGATGSGKSYLACALGHQACRIGISTRYYRVSRLLDELTLARGDGSYPKLIQRLARTPGSSSSTTGDSLRSRDRDETTSSRSSTTATLAAARCSPAKSPSTTGTMSSATPPSATPSSTGCSTTLTASSSRADR